MIFNLKQPFNDIPISGKSLKPEKKKRDWGKTALIGVAITYLTFIIFVPTLYLFVQAFSAGVTPFLKNLKNPAFVDAVRLTVLIPMLIVPLNAVFGLFLGWLITERGFRAKPLVLSIIDLPLAVTPVLVGLMIWLVFGQHGWFGPLLQATNLKIVFALPGIVLVSGFITFPYIVRQVIPALAAARSDQEQAARTLGANDWVIFRDIILPQIRWALFYGVILATARAIGEFGAVSVVSGNIIRQTQTLTLFIQDAYKQYDTESAFSAAVLLAFLAMLTLFLKEILKQKN